MPDRSDRLTSVLTPRTVAVLGASSQRHTLGNQVLHNFAQEGFTGTVIPVNPRVEVIEGRATVPAIADLPRGLDVAMACIPAASLPEVLAQLEAVRCQAAVVPTAGFSAAEYERLQETCRSIEMMVTGPNCLGILSLTDCAPLWTARYRASFPRGPVSLVAQSGSAAISIMSSLGLGFSRIISSGSELEVTSADYIRWLADDPATGCIGLVVESIRSPESFAGAVAAAHSAGKQVVALKVGRSLKGSLAAEAHTGALVSDYDGYKAFFARHGVPTVLDYDEMVGTLQCFAKEHMPPAAGGRVGIVGISGGQVALACDVAADVGAELADFSEATVRRVEAALPDAPGRNPVDIGASVGAERRRSDEALQAVLDDPGVDSVLVIQDAQGTIPLDPGHMYVTQVSMVERVARQSTKPLVLASSSAGDTHRMLTDIVEDSAVPFIRGLRPALVALRNLAARPAPPAPPQDRPANLDELRTEVAAHRGPLPYRIVRSLLDAYDIPFVRSLLAVDSDEALERAGEVGYPLVVKVASPDVPHRLEMGGVVVDVVDADGLASALGQIADNLAASAPSARIEGYELQQWIPTSVQSVVGFASAPPFGPMMVVGSGGSAVELLADRCADLAPLGVAGAVEMIRGTALGRILSGYREIVEPTDLSGLATVLCNLSSLADDFCGLIREGDLNPALVEPGTGRVTVVDALLVAGGD